MPFGSRSRVGLGPVGMVKRSLLRVRIQPTR
jgi:hypothetical protein